MFLRKLMESGEAGFTVVELLIVVATLAVLAAVLLPKVTAMIQKRRAMRDLVEINRVVEGLGKFYEDCGTYPTEMKGLVAPDGTNTLNGSDMTQCWQGPYIKYKLVAGSSTDLQGFMGTANHLSLEISPNNGDLNNDGNANDYAIKITGMPEPAAKYLESKIDGDDPNSTSAPTTGQWVYTCTGGVCTCQFIFRELS